MRLPIQAFLLLAVLWPKKNNRTVQIYPPTTTFFWLQYIYSYLPLFEKGICKGHTRSNFREFSWYLQLWAKSSCFWMLRARRRSVSGIAVLRNALIDWPSKARDGEVEHIPSVWLESSQIYKSGCNDPIRHGPNRSPSCTEKLCLENVSDFRAIHCGQ